MGILSDYVFQRTCELQKTCERRAERRSAEACAVALGSFLRAIGDEWNYPDDLPPMFFETKTLTNGTEATIDVWGPRLGSITLGPGESITRPVPYMEHLRVAKTTAADSFSVTVTP